MAQKRFSKEGFQPLPEDGNTPMANPNDATINIPLTKVNSQGQTGARKITGNLSPTSYRAATDFPSSNINEKTGLYHRGPGGRRRKKMEERGREHTDNEDGTLTMMGKLYKAIFNFSIVTRYFLYVLPLALAIAVPIVIGATFAKKATIGGVRIVWFFTWIEILWLSLWVSKLTAQFLPHVFQFLCGIVSSGTRKYSVILTALEIPLSLVGWAVTALTTFVPLMCLNPDQRSQNDTGLKNWESVVKDILFATFFSTLILLAEKLLVQLISISYHRKQFDQKIKQSKRNIYLLSLLYDASRNLFPAYCPEFAAEDYLINDSLDLGSRGQPQARSKHGRSGSATPMRFIQDVGRVGDKLTAAFGNVAHEITGKQVFNPTSAHSIVVEALEKNACSEALARRLWMSFVIEGKDALYQEDIVDVLGPDHTAEAEECFQCLDRDGNGDISLDEMILTVCEYGKERYSIANSMHDVDQAINVLDNLLCTVAFIIVVFIFVAFLNKSFSTTLATAGTALLSLSFVFAVTAQEVLGSCIFLFVKHPYDVGDRVDIGDNQLVVERISLLFTVFRKVKDHKTTQVPNIILNSNWIDNVTRSKAMREQVFLSVNADTTLEDIQLLKKEMSAFVVDKDNSRDFQPDIEVELTGLAEMNKLELKVEIRHKSNWANEAIRASRRSKFMCALVLALRKVPIYGPGAGAAAAGDPANPTYSVAISHEMAEANKKEFAENKEKKHMSPVGAAPVKSITNLSPTIAKSSAVNLGITSEQGSSITSAAKDSTLLRSLDPMSAALADVRDGPSDEPARLDTQRNSDIEEVRNILREESVTGRRRAPTVSRSPQSSVPFVSAPIAPPPNTTPASKVNYYEETSAYRPSAAANMTAPPRGSSRDYGANNPYVPQLQTGNQSQGLSGGTSPVSNRRLVPGNASSRFPVAPNTAQNGYGGQTPGQK